jgi:hypothetical protein
VGQEDEKMPNVTIDISRSRIASLLCCALEGGIGYWAQIKKYIEPPKDADLFAGLDDSWQGDVFRHIHYPMCEAGGGLVFQDATGEGFPNGKTVTLDYATILKGLEVMSKKEPKHFGDFLEENEDATTGDVFVQCCVFGEVVFG